MIDILNRFLFQNKSISIPGLGTIHAERIPAKMDAASHGIIAPSFRFRFDKYFDAPDKNFFTYLSVQKNIPDFEAMRLYNQFAQDFRSGIMTEEKLNWDEIGFFRKNNSGEIEFVQTGYQEKDYLVLPEIPQTAGLSLATEPATLSLPQELVAVEPPELPATATIADPPDEIAAEVEYEEPDIKPANRLEKTLFYVAAALLALSLVAAGMQFGKYGFSAKAWSNRQPVSAAIP